MQISAFEQEQLKAGRSLVWLNGAYQRSAASTSMPAIVDLYAAEARLARFAPLLSQLFPELEASAGVIESSLLQAEQLNSRINPLGGRLLLKTDNELPVAGSIKARGGIHEVLWFAEKLALENGLISSLEDDYCVLANDAARRCFARYTLVVGSTGNLGLSVGVMSKALGFNVTVHMSAEAKSWKKERLAQCGARVVEHDSDYGKAVLAGRNQGQVDPYSYFVDDEKSPHLFMGYAVAALRLKRQLAASGIIVDEQHPLFVYLPAGVGGAPGGISFGLKHLFGDHVHCFFAEPVQAPCMLLGLAGEAGSEPASVYDFGLAIDTDADGLAVGQASQWVCDAVRGLVSGVYTATDTEIFRQLQLLKALENVKVEPSAAISCLGPQRLASEQGRQYLKTQQLEASLSDSTHVLWLTGGSLVPESEYQAYLEKAQP